MIGSRRARDEREFYDAAADDPEREGDLVAQLADLRASAPGWLGSADVWLDNAYDSVAQLDVYDHLAPAIVDGHVVQLGGTGKEAFKALIAGAAKATLVSPFEGELEFATSVANRLGIGARFAAVLGSGEESNLPADGVDALISTGCLHHTDVPAALLEIRRVLKAGGRFGAWDPWHARLYTVGIRVLGKREPGVECRPLNPRRLATLTDVFPDSTVRLHGALTRYPLLALQKAGIEPAARTIHRIALLDDRVSAHAAWLRRNGSSISVVGRRQQERREAPAVGVVSQRSPVGAEL